VIPQGTSNNGYTFAPHDAKPTVKVAGAYRIGVGVGATCIEAAVNAPSASRQVLREKMRMAKRMTEQRPACLVEILTIDEN
jgi:hypothetical protein